MNVACGEKREDQKTVAVGDFFDAAEIAVDDVAFHRRALEQKFAKPFLLIADLLAAFFHFGIREHLFQRRVAQEIDHFQPVGSVAGVFAVCGH